MAILSKPSPTRDDWIRLTFESVAFTAPLSLTATTNKVIKSSSRPNARLAKRIVRCTLRSQNRASDAAKADTPPETAVGASTTATTSPPPLPTSSHIALQASIALMAAAICLPCGLALRDAIAASDDVLTHIGHYASHFKVVAGTIAFGTIHSGLASVRPKVSSYIGERLFRLIFFIASLPSAVALITYFIAHRYDGAQLFSLSLQSYPLTHTLVYGVSFISFLLLYPATFNLLELGAALKPTVRIYETGMMRITRHPQLFGQAIWCVAHTAWIGSSFMVVTSLAVVAHHLFGAWNGDRRLRDRFGDAWIEYANRTSIVPFAAILSGQQTFDVMEILRPAYVGVVAATLGFYAVHPIVLRAVSQLHW